MSIRTEYPIKMCPLDTSKPWPIMLNFLPIIRYAFEQCSKNLRIMLNIMPITTAIMPQFVYDFIIFND